jgi:predicted NUDIX family NTP pyrophosphohydrolase
LQQPVAAGQESLNSVFCILDSSSVFFPLSVMRISAGLLMYRISEKQKLLEVLLVHPGGPYWKNKDDRAWTIPRGNVEQGEDLLVAAIREFSEETGLVPDKPFISLGEIRHRSGKRVHVWAFSGSCDPASISSNTFEIEWPPKSGRRERFPEIDKAGFFTVPLAKQKILPDERPLLDRLVENLPGFTLGSFPT